LMTWFDWTQNRRISHTEMHMSQESYKILSAGIFWYFTSCGSGNGDLTRWNPHLIPFNTPVPHCWKIKQVVVSFCFSNFACNFLEFSESLFNWCTYAFQVSFTIKLYQPTILYSCFLY
jgi:hypothetical protein